MDLLSVLRQRIEAVPAGDYSLGLRAVLQHIEVAVQHLERGTRTPDETAFTDAIYRTNQAFEGSLKEAYRVIAGKDPANVRPFDIETYFQEHSPLRARVLAQLSNYRTEWRNPATHDYRLDFNEDEALLAIVSVCAFAIVLIDQITEKLSFEAAKAATRSTLPSVNPRKPLADQVADALQQFRTSPSPARTHDLVREAELLGALAGYLTSAIPGATVDTEPDLGSAAHPDLIVTHGDERLIVEVKRARHVVGPLRQQFLAQVSHYIAITGISEALIYGHSSDIDLELVREEYQLPGVKARIVILWPRHDKKK